MQKDVKSNQQSVEEGYVEIIKYQELKILSALNYFHAALDRLELSKKGGNSRAD